MSASPSLILAIDQGTTGSRAVLYDSRGHVRGSSYREFRQYYPRPGWVEHDPREILNSVSRVVREALAKARSSFQQIAGIGITNQRETTLLWERKSGRPVGRAIVWQDRRTAGRCEALKRQGHEALFRRKTGLLLDPYFSGTKIQWMLEESASLKKRAARGEILFGTVDSWLLWNLTGGRVHATDATNASRTLLLNLQKVDWDSEILKILGIPKAILPEVHSSCYPFGKTSNGGPLKSGIPVFSLVGDQQAALYGQGCYRAGEMKNTYGTGCFLMMNQGKTRWPPKKGLLETLACDIEGKPVYALEGAVFIAGAALQWLRDGLGFIRKAAETEKIARQIKETGGVVVVPAFTGLGAPYWDPHARGAILGITRGTRREHIIRATLESIAYQSADVFEGMADGLSRRPSFVKADGGAARNNFLMQLQADLLGVPVLRSDRTESTAWGAAKLAGVGCGLWKSAAGVDRLRRYRKFQPRMALKERNEKLSVWRRAVRRLL